MPVVFDFKCIFEQLGTQLSNHRFIYDWNMLSFLFGADKLLAITLVHIWSRKSRFSSEFTLDKLYHFSETTETHNFIDGLLHPEIAVEEIPIHYCRF